MPRRSKGPRLYIDRTRDQFVIRDGPHFVRTGCGSADVERAERALADYIGRKHKPQPGPSPSIADVLLAYGKDKGGYGRRAENIRHVVGNLLRWWGDKPASAVTSKFCRDFASMRPPAAARRDLETLKAAINHWHKEYGPLAFVPSVWLPPKQEARQRWLTRSEVSALLSAARRTPHLARFILLGIYTGTRAGALFALQWSWINLESGVMHRRAPGEPDSATKRRPPVRLGRKILAHLRRWRRQDNPRIEHVIHSHGRPVKDLDKAWRKARLKAGLDADVTPHCLRRTRACWLLQAGVSIWEAAGHLGMSVDTLTRVYGQHHPNWQKRAADV